MLRTNKNEKSINGRGVSTDMQYNSINGYSKQQQIQLITKKFNWLNPILRWNCMWIVKNVDYKYRSFFVNFFGLFLTVIQIFSYPVFTYYDDNPRTSFDSFFDVTHLIVFSISRLIALKYFLFDFDYPWMHIFDNNYSKQLFDYYLSKSKSTSLWLKLYVIISFVLIPSHIIVIYTYIYIYIFTSI